jgi:hypothetical protein
VVLHGVYSILHDQCFDAWGSWNISVVLDIGKYSRRLSMVMHSSEHISLEPTLEGADYVVHLSCLCPGREITDKYASARAIRTFVWC